MRIAILYSGGLDSFIMLQMAKIMHPGAEIDAYYFDHGQPVAQKEMKHLPYEVHIKRLDWLNETNTPRVQPGRREGAIMIPGRNLVLGVLLACQELPDEIWMGTLHGETHSKGTDKNWTFLSHMSEVVNYVLGPFREYKKIQFRFPLAEMQLNKGKAVQWALDHGASMFDLLATVSCHHPEYLACGECIQCYKRWAVFSEHGFTEAYRTHPMHSEFGKQFTYDLLCCELGLDNYYEPDTRAEILPALLSIYDFERQHPEVFSMFEERSFVLLRQIYEKSRLP